MSDESKTRQYTSGICSDGKKRGRPVVTNQASKPCLTKDCSGRCGGDDLPKGQKGARGLCKRCHSAASRLVRNGKTTWTELEELGLALPKYNSILEMHLIKARQAKMESAGG